MGNSKQYNDGWRATLTTVWHLLILAAAMLSPVIAIKIIIAILE